MDRWVVRRTLQGGTTALLVLAAGCSSGNTIKTGPPQPTSTRPSQSVAASSASPSPTSRPAALKIGLPKFPAVLADAAGRAVYTFSLDEHGNTNCFDACAAVWPPVLSAGVPTIIGGDPQDVGTQGRGNGTTQATFDGWPLYYFSGDKKPGEVNGTGRIAFGGQWFLIAKNSDRIGR